MGSAGSVSRAQSAGVKAAVMSRASPERADATQIGWPRRFGAEMFGTFALVFVAAGADSLAASGTGEPNAAARAVAPALIVAAFIYALGDVSGAHLNPVVTLAFAVKRLLPVRWVAPYMLAQVAGALVAAGLLRLLLGEASDAGVSATRLPAATAAAMEAFLTLLLVTVILGTADRYRVVGPDAALAVGATIAACALIAIPIGGASMNPARSLGPALIAGRVGDAWIYVVGPVTGALGAAIITRALHGPTEQDGSSEEAAQGG